VQQMEIWRPVSDFGSDSTKYEISSEGQVRSTQIFRNKETKIRILKPFTSGKRGKEYPAVKLRLPEGGSRTKMVHLLVARAFLGPRPDGYLAAHLDGDRFNPKYSNLAWSTSAGNESHKYIHGTIMRGESHYRAKLNDSIVVGILTSKEKSSVLSVELNLSARYVRAIREGRKWRHVGERIGYDYKAIKTNKRLRENRA